MTVHVVGAGVAGLSAATHLLHAGADVRVHEAAPIPGGRCRSYHDPMLGRLIDTGTHLLLGANTAALTYLKRLDALGRMIEMAPAAYPFFDLASGHRWVLRATPWGLASAFRPVALAALNTEPEEASWLAIASVFGRLLAESACRPWIARHGIGDAMVEPAATRLGERLRCGRRLTAIESGGRQATALLFGDERVTLSRDDRVILALPPVAISALLPEMTLPTETRAIVNAHFRVSAKPESPRLMGLVGGLAQWALWRDDVISATVSAADGLLAESAEALAARFWPELARAFDLADEAPVWRIVKERRATIAATRRAERSRPPARTHLANLVLAGDWIRTGFPATLEGAVRSGEAAARLALAQGNILG
ncbi:MAG: hypothetical protein FJX60_11290 [Alphaproteobacteria bacterium]|nr:hypothetical protein [Alphaproteobacteria bacterium]